MGLLRLGMLCFGVGLFVACVAAVTVGVTPGCVAGGCDGVWAVAGGGALATLGVLVGGVGVLLDVVDEE